MTLVCIAKKLPNTEQLTPKTDLLNSGAVVPPCQSGISTLTEKNFQNLLLWACYEMISFRRKICDGILMYSLSKLIRSEISGIKLKLESD